MARDEAKATEILAEGNGSSLSSDQAKSQTLAGSGSDEGGVKVSAGNNEGLNGDIGSDNGGVVILTSRIVETEVSVATTFGGEDKAVLGVENEMGDGLDSALGVDNDEGNGVQKSRSKRDSSVLNGDGSDKKVEYNGGGISLVVEVHGSSGGANENEKNIGCDDDDDKGSLAENRKFTELTGSMSKEGEIQEVTEDKGNEEVNANKEDEDEEEEDDDDDDDDVGDENHEYLVGDFVWGKIRSHPWWPGQIYDPSDASAYAAKYKQKDRLLVAYFGDGSFSWCKSSQLKPFAENYIEMSKQSNSKGFVNAVQMALDEISRTVELEMTCKCIAEENQIRVSGPVVNGGIRAGVLVPGGSTGKQLISLHEPEKLIASLSCLARVISISNLLELTVLKSWLTAFYRAKGGYQLANYHEPKCIEGLEDKNRNGVLDTTDFSDPVEVPIEEDWVSSPVDPVFVKCNRLVSQKGPEISEDKLYQRRKQKSVAELMKEEMDVEPKDRKRSIVKGTASGKKKRMANDETESQDNSVLTPPSGGKKRGRKKKVEVSGSPKTTENKASSVENGNVRGEEANASPLTRGKKSNKGSSVENGDGRTKEETVKSSELRGKKRNKGSSVENGDGRMKEETVKSSELQGKKRNKVSSDENHDGRTKEETVKSSELRGKKRNKVSSGGNDDSCTKEETLKSIVARERKKSRYLSPPYTDLSWTIRNSNSKRDSETDSEKKSNITRMGERMTRAAGKLIGSPTISKSSGKTVENKVLKELGGGEEAPETEKQDHKQNINSMEVDANPNEVLSEIKSAALNPLYLREKRDLDMIIGFIYGFRSSVFLNGSNYKVYHKRQSGRKRKEMTDSQQTGNELNEPMPKLKKNDKEARTRASSSVALVLTFPPAFSLPSKNDIIKIFTKFGALNETETDVFYNSYSARVVFVKSSDAEEAFNVSVEKSPFGTANVNFRLRYSAREKASSPTKKAPENPLGFVREKLEMITSMLENSGGRISSQMKSSLQGEMKGLLEKVSAMESTSS